MATKFEEAMEKGQQKNSDKYLRPTYFSQYIPSSLNKEQEQDRLNEYIKALHKEINDNSDRLGVKFDKDKPKWNLLPWNELEDVVHVLTFGAKKYAPDNWKFVDDANNRYMDAAMRHLVAHQQGEQRDAESGESHIAHALCCLLFMLWHDKNDNAS